MQESNPGGPLPRPDHTSPAPLHTIPASSLQLASGHPEPEPIPASGPTLASSQETPGAASSSMKEEASSLCGDGQNPVTP